MKICLILAVCIIGCSAQIPYPMFSKREANPEPMPAPEPEANPEPEPQGFPIGFGMPPQNVDVSRAKRQLIIPSTPLVYRSLGGLPITAPLTLPPYTRRVTTYRSLHYPTYPVSSYYRSLGYGYSLDHPYSYYYL